MIPTLTRKTLRDDRRAIIGWAVGIAAFIAVYLAFYPSIANNQAGMDFIEQFTADLPAGLLSTLGWQDFASGAGYLDAVVYSAYVPLLVIMFAAVLGNRAIAAPEEAGTLDLLLANPISRRRFVAERFAALIAAVLAVGFVVWLVVLAFNAGLDMGVPVGNLTAATAGLTLLGAAFGSLALAVGAATGRRATVFAVTAALAAGTYLLRALGAQVEAINSLRWLSPFHYYLGGDPLRTGFDAGHLLVLGGITAVLAAVAIFAFGRRDVGV